MESTIQLLAIVLAVLAWIISFIQLRRSRRQNNEDLVWQNKIDAYKRILLHGYTFLQRSYFMLDELADFKGDVDLWVDKRMPEIFREINPLIDQMDSTFIENVILFPDGFVKKYNDFSFKSQRLLTEHYQFNNENSINNYLTLSEMHNELVNEVRKDLHIDLLNEKLMYRLRK